MVPRTRHSERIRARIITHRIQRRDNGNNESEQTENNNVQEIENMEAGPSGLSSSTTTHRSRKRHTKRKKRSSIKVTYNVNQSIGGTVAIKTKIKRRMKKGQAKRHVMSVKSVKKRLARHLGMCPSKNATNLVPEVKTQQFLSNPLTTMNFQKNKAGIPALDLFGQRHDLDYYSGVESETESGGNVMIHRRTISSDVINFRRAARRKAIIASTLPTSANILDSILESQSKLHSKDSELFISNDGNINFRKKSNIIRDICDDKSTTKSNENHLNLNNYNKNFRQRPIYGNGSTDKSNSLNIDSNDYNPYNITTNSTTMSSSETLPNVCTDDTDGDVGYFPQSNFFSPYECDLETKKDKDGSRNTNESDSEELDIYSDIETVSTSKVEEPIRKLPSPALIITPNNLTDEEANSDVDLIIDTDKVDSDKHEDNKVTSTVDSIASIQMVDTCKQSTARSTTEIQNQTIQSSNSVNEKDIVDTGDEEEYENDGCPNYRTYSFESQDLAKATDMQLLNESVLLNKHLSDEKIEANIEVNVEINNYSNPMDLKSVQSYSSNQLTNTSNQVWKHKVELAKLKSSEVSKNKKFCGLYSDSEDDNIVKIDSMPQIQRMQLREGMDCEGKLDVGRPFAIIDISNMTEDISEEERSYTPCLDERIHREGLEGLDTELISDEDRNDFDESHDLKTASDGDALEINAKESELDFTKPEDYEEGEIVDKLKKKMMEENKLKENIPETKLPKDKETKDTAPPSFKKLSKNNKERNYRDKDKKRSKSKERREKEDKENKKDRRKEKRRELERYNVRSLIAEKPRRQLKDKFGRDKTRGRSGSSRSLTPPRRSVSIERRSISKERKRRKSRSKSRCSNSRSRSKSTDRKRSRSRTKKRQSLSKERKKKRKSRDRSKQKLRKRSRSVQKSRSPVRRQWIRRRSRAWSRSISRSLTPPEQRLTPSWTPPRLIEQQQTVTPHNLTVILNNDINKKKKEKKKKVDKKKDSDKVNRKRKKEKTPPPSKEVFASGNNILVSVSFNKETNEREVSKRKQRESIDDLSTKRTRKEKEKRKNEEKRKKKSRDLSGVKPVAIIDLERSPFRELTPSPEDIIVLSDSENGETSNTLELQIATCDSSQQVTSPEQRSNSICYQTTGPKTPPEPQIKFSLNPKPQQLRAITNPLHEPDDIEAEIDAQEELEQRLNESMHKGPNTPPEPPNSPPSSPDAYDPFDPTKSRSPTPEPTSQTIQVSNSQNDVLRNESPLDSRNDVDLAEIDNINSLTPPVTDIQPADSQSNIKAVTPEKSPEHPIGVIINQVVQSQPVFPMIVSKSLTSYSTSMITSTPISNLAPSRVNILNSTMITPPSLTPAVPQRIVLPNAVKSSPVKVSPNKQPIKSTPIKPMPVKNIAGNKSKQGRKSVHGQNGSDDAQTDFDSPYSPGSSDYEDLFEPPSDSGTRNVIKSSNQNQKSVKSPTKPQTAFDALFGASPINISFKNGNNKGNKMKPVKYKKAPKGEHDIKNY